MKIIIIGIEVGTIGKITHTTNICMPTHAPNDRILEYIHQHSNTKLIQNISNAQRKYAKSGHLI